MRGVLVMDEGRGKGGEGGLGILGGRKWGERYP